MVRCRVRITTSTIERVGGLLRSTVQSERKRRFLSQSVILGFVLLFIILVVTAVEPRFLSRANLLNILQQTAVLGIASLGMNMVMISGGLDLSIGNNIALTACVISTLVSQNYPVALAVLIGFVVALTCGLLNGVIIAKSGGFPFIITLGTMAIFNGIALVITRGESHSLMGRFQFLGQGRVGFIPVSTIIWAVLAVLTYLLLKYSKYGRQLFMIGGNEKAAFFSGIEVVKNKIAVYTVNGAIVGVAAIVLVSRLGSAVPATGSGYELRAIAAVVIGGASLFGGRGSVLGCLLGTVLMGIVSNALNALNVSYFYQGLILGVIIIGAAVVSTSGESRQ
jgi:ribose/xylose/arabinose/galactoside ABC-type transport system permease subunit